MTNIFIVLGFGWHYLRRYWVRLAAGILLSILFALSSASFVWATGMLTERFSAKPEQTEKMVEKVSESGNWFSTRGCRRR